MNWGNISAQKLETECLKVLLCPFHCKTRPSRLSLASKGLENIPQVPGSRAKVGENHHARKAVSATLSVLGEVGLYFGPEGESERSKSCAVSISPQTKAIRS